MEGERKRKAGENEKGKKERKKKEGRQEGRKKRSNRKILDQSSYSGPKMKKQSKKI